MIYVKSRKDNGRLGLNKTYCFDIDNTICITEGTDYENSKPIKERIEIINALKDEGNTIIFFTARAYPYNFF